MALNFDDVFGQPLDVPGMDIEDVSYGAFDFVPELGKGIARGFLNLGAGVVGTADWLTETLTYPIYSVLPDEMKKKADRFNQFIFDDRKRKIVMARKSLAADPENAAAWVGAVVGEAIPYIAGTLAGGAAAGAGAAAAGASTAGVSAASMAGAASVGFAVEGDLAYENAIEGGATKEQANLERVIVGSVNAAIETLQASHIMKIGKSSKGLKSVGKLKQAVRAKMLQKIGKSGAVTADVLWTALGEGLEEGGQEITSILVPALLRDDVDRREDGNVDWKKIFTQIGGSVVGGAVAGGIFGGAKIMSGHSSFSKDPKSFNEIQLDKADEVVKSSRELPKLTNQEKKYAKNISEKFGISIKEARQAVAATSPRRLSGALSKSEKARSVVLQLGDTNTQNLRSQKVGWRKSSTVSNQAVEDTLAWVHELGGVPSNPDLRSDFMYDMRNAVSLRERQLRSKNKLELRGREKTQLSGWQAIRYALGEMSIASGHNIGSTWSNMNTKANEAKNSTVKRMSQIYEDIGVRPIDMHLTYEENNAMAEYLFTGDEDAISDLSKEKRDLADKLNEVLQTDGKKAVTAIRWKLWNQHGIEPESIKKADRKKILEEGRKAEQEGKLEKWLDKQKWAAKEKYYMSESETDLADDVMEKLQPSDVSKPKRAMKPKTTPREARTRKGKAEWKKGSVVDNIHNHLSKLNTTLAVMDDMSVFWKQFADADPSSKDNAMMKKFFDNMMGRRTEDEWVAWILRNSTSYFWRFHFFNPAKAAYFFTRNILQNAYMGSQMSIPEISRASKSIMEQVVTGRYNQGRVEQFNKHWENSISQKQQMWEQALLMETEGSLGK